MIAQCILNKSQITLLNEAPLEKNLPLWWFLPLTLQQIQQQQKHITYTATMLYSNDDIICITINV